ncbi:Protein of unknown function [Bosea sp. OK403]|nr:Protein of unknown function [Bosea sp. OK403]
MKCFVGLDVSVKTTSGCLMDAGGTIVREGKTDSSPEAIAAFLSACSDRYSRVGLEAGPLCQWLYAGLAKAGFPVICIETRHAQAALSASPNKTDRNDARGIAQMMRVGLHRPVHVKTLASQKIRALLSGRRFLQAKLLDVENSIRGLRRSQSALWRRWRRSESWLASPNTFLNARPIEKLQTVTGLIEVIAHLDARRALV